MMLQKVEPPIRPEIKSLDDLEKYDGSEMLQETDEGLMLSNFSYSEVPCLI